MVNDNTQSRSGKLGRGKWILQFDAEENVGAPLKVAVLIPALNAAQTIKDLVRRIARFIPQGRIIVVDDGSTDDTAHLAQSAGAIVISHVENAGKGAALQTGFRHILANHYDGVIVLDADGQHDPQSIPDFLRRASRGDADMLVGSRMSAVGEMPWMRVFTNRITSACISALAGQKVPDSQSGYRYISRDVLRVMRLRTSRYDTESEMLIQAGRMGYRIGSLYISSIYGEEKSAIRPIRDTLRFIFLIIRTSLSI